MFHLKEKLLGFYTKHMIKSNRIAHWNVGYQQAKLVGLVYTQENAAKKAIIKEFIDQLKKRGKQVNVLHYIPKLPAKNQPLDTTFPTFAARDINYLGQCKNPQLVDFINKPFDYLYHVDGQSNAILDYVLAKCQARCRVGVFDSNRTKLFEMMVNCEQKDDIPLIKHVTDQMLHYTQLLTI